MKEHVALVVLGASMIVWGACSPGSNIHVEPTPLPMPTMLPLDGGEDPAGCPGACEVLREFKCREGFVTKHGISCESICRDAINSGYLTWPARCAINAVSLDGMKACGFTCALPPALSDLGAH